MNLIDILFIPINKIKKTIGKTDDTGGSSSAGTVMGKLNNLITSSISGGSIADDNITYIPNMNWTPTIYNSTLKVTTIAASDKYVVCKNGSTNLIKIDPITLSQISTLTTGYGISNMFIDGDYLYCCDDTNKKVIKIDLVTFSKVGESQVLASNATGIFVYNEKIYYAQGSPAKVVMLDISNLNVLGETSIQSGYSDGLFVYDGYIYYADNSSKKIIKFNATTLDSVQETLAQSGTIKYPVVTKNGIFCVDTSNRKVIGFDINTMVKNKESSSQTGTVMTKTSTYGEIIYLYNFTSKLITAYKTTTLDSVGITSTQVNSSGLVSNKYGVYTGENSSMKMLSNQYQVVDYKVKGA